MRPLVRRWFGAFRSPVDSAGAEMLGEFPFQATTGLDEQRQINRLMGHVHRLNTRVRVA